jgi:RimJ/RimL family protein N-acetyltransferase
VRRLELDLLAGRHVVLEPMRPDHVEELAAATGGDRSSFAYTRVPEGLDDTAAYVDWLLRDAADGAVGPFVQRRVADGRLVGCTRYLHPDWPLDRDVPDEIEIGGTWLCADAQRSPINTESKLLLLSHAFERWNVQRVAICTDARNQRSRAAIERLGVAFEGVLRRHRASTHAGDGDRLRDSAMYAVTVDDWPIVRERLVGLLDA